MLDPLRPVGGPSPEPARIERLEKVHRRERGEGDPRERRRREAQERNDEARNPDEHGEDGHIDLLA